MTGRRAEQLAAVGLRAGRSPATDRLLAKHGLGLSPTEQVIALARHPAVASDALPIPAEWRREADDHASDDLKAWARHVAARVTNTRRRKVQWGWSGDLVPSGNLADWMKRRGGAAAVAQSSGLDRRNLERIAAGERRRVRRSTVEVAVGAFGLNFFDVYEPALDDKELYLLLNAVDCADKRLARARPKFDGLLPLMHRWIELLFADGRRELAAEPGAEAARLLARWDRTAQEWADSCREADETRRRVEKSFARLAEELERRATSVAPRCA